MGGGGYKGITFESVDPLLVVVVTDGEYAEEPGVEEEVGVVVGLLPGSLGGAKEISGELVLEPPGRGSEMVCTSV